MKALSLFSGIGGIDLAAEWAGIETVAMCEREPFCQKVLKKHWPHVPIYDDVCTLTKERLEADGIGTIDLIHGGYPCQPFSIAGKREGANDDRHLWPEVFRLLQEIRPNWFVGENVAGHVTMGLDDVLSDLENISYTSQPFIIPAAAIGAPQRRERVFIVAHSNDRQCEFENKEVQAGRTPAQHGSEDVANTYCERREELDITTSSNELGQHTRRTFKARSTRELESILDRMLDGVSSRLDGHKWPAGMGQEQYTWEPPRVVAYKGENRNNRIAALGNAVNPYQIYPILAAIKQIDDMMEEETL